MRERLTQFLIIPVLKITGYRFSKNFRHEITFFHSLVYNSVDTVGANIGADGGVWKIADILAAQKARNLPPITDNDPLAGIF